MQESARIMSFYLCKVSFSDFCFFLHSLKLMKCKVIFTWWFMNYHISRIFQGFSTGKGFLNFKASTESSIYREWRQEDAAATAVRHHCYANELLSVTHCPYARIRAFAMIYLSSCSVLAVCGLIIPHAEVYLHMWYRGGC